MPGVDGFFREFIEVIVFRACPPVPDGKEFGGFAVPSEFYEFREEFSS